MFRYDPTGHATAVVVGAVVVDLAVVMVVGAFEVDVVVLVAVVVVDVVTAAVVEVTGLPDVLDVVDSLELVVVCCIVTDTQRNNTTYCNLFIAYPGVQCIIYTVDTILLLYFF